MCGIAGWYRRDNRSVPTETIRRQCDSIRHRGPDDAGHFADNDFGMGMRRLSIIDVAGGHQPIRSPDRRYSVVFNGEIYNHPELRPKLEEKGYCFRTHSDTEVLLAAFAVWGDDAWLQLDGMYAVAIWDHLMRVLTLARDPLGIKPLYITEQKGGIAFASELKALTFLPEHEFDVSERAVYDFLRFGQIQRPRSIYRQARQLDPGHVLTIGADGPASTRQFWKPRISVNHALSEDEWIEETRSRLLQTVKKHMLSDVPVGSFLSAGVDSSAVTAAMAQQSSQPFTAFTIGFPGNPMNESATAQRTAERLGCKHVVLPLKPQQTRDAIPEMQRAFDEPLGTRSGAVASWHISKLAAEHVKVVLCGDGGDELFAGYKRQRNAMRMERWKPLIRAIGPLASLIGRIPMNSSRKWNYIKQWIEPVRDSAGLETGFQRFFAGTEICSANMRKRVFSPDFLQQQELQANALEAEYFTDPDWRDLDTLQQIMLGDLLVHMPAGPLTRLDRTSMAHSLEARVPLLSRPFVDWSLTVPNRMKTKGKGKHILREAVRPWLPSGVLERRKQGFQVPLADWFLDDLSSFATEAWRESGLAAAGYLNSSAVDTLLAEHRAGQADHGKILYAITVFSCWWNERNRGSPGQQTV